MDTTNAIKRKKRKTRKCLDEIRKRSRNDYPKTCNPVTQKLENHNENTYETKYKNLYSNYITNNRLTLALFPKAIRSETVTRPVLSETASKRKLIYCPETTSKFSISPNIDSNITEENINTALENHKDTSLENNQECENLSNHNKSCGLILLSPSQSQQSVNSLFEDSPNREPLSSPASSTDSSRVGFGYHLYTEFMNDIPAYLKVNVPAIIREDVMVKSKALLQSIYMEGCHQANEDSVRYCRQSRVLTQTTESFTPGEVAVQDPKDNIRLGYTWRQNVISNYEESSPSTASSDSLNSTHSIQEAILPPVLVSSIHDTPEYTYYPHRLNQ